MSQIPGNKFNGTTDPVSQESLQQEVQALQHLDTETIGKRNCCCEEAALEKDHIQRPCCCQRLTEAPQQRDMDFCEQAACPAANSTRLTLTMQSVGFPSLDMPSHVRAETSPSSSYLRWLFKVLLLKRMAQMVSILHPSEIHTTAEHEFLAGNVAKNDSP
ncbi:hypothetical protein Nmel_004277 [Mimus melanotis]